MSKFWKIALLLLSISFLAENMGFFTHQMNLIIGILCLAPFVLLYFPPIKFEKIDKKLAIAGAIIAVTGVVLLPQELLIRLSGLCLFLIGLDIFLRSLGREEPELPVLLTTLISFTLFMTLVKYTPLIWSGLNNFSLSLSTMVTFITKQDISLGITFSGLYTTILFALLFISSHLFSVKKRVWHLIVFLAVLLVVNVVYIVFFAYLPSIVHFFQSLLKDEALAPGAPMPPLATRDLTNLPVALFLLLLVPLTVYLKGRQFQALSLMPKKAEIKLIVSCLVLLALSLASLTISFPVNFTPHREVVFYEKGFLNWEVPTFERFGSRSAGMFGNLPAFVEAMGLKQRRISEISPSSLSGAKVLVLINIKDELPQAEVEAVWEFVRNGGSLLMMGDHTFIGDGGKNWLNEILKPTGIRYNFDSADYFIGGWLHSFEYMRHPLTHYLGDEENEPGIVVGASLETRYPAVPVVMGKYGYSDMGNPFAYEGGYLGNFEHDMSEQLGDLVLTAEQKFGKGKVLVFGDTSSFVNPIMVSSYPFVNRVFTYLASDSTPKNYIIPLVLFLLFLAAAVVLFLRTSRNMAALFLSVLVMLLIVALAPFISSRGIERPLTGNIAYVDASHLGRYSLEGWRDNGTMGLQLNLMRNGYLSFQLEEFSQDKIANSKLLVFIAPTRPFSGSEVKMLTEYVKNGGHIILTVGWEERKASESLLKAFGFRLEPVPLGYFKTRVPGTEVTAMFWEGWAVNFEDGETEVIAGYETYPAICIKHYGEGEFVVVGDSSFLLNKNLEMEETFNEDNVNFLSWLLWKLAVS